MRVRHGQYYAGTPGWDESLPTLLLLSGGAGLCSVIETAHALDAATTPHQLVIVCGNQESASITGVPLATSHAYL
jgi:hypothetical protein